MALGKMQNSDNGKLYVLRLKNKITDPATGKEIPLVPVQFEVSEKNESGKWVARKEFESRVSGNIVKIETDEKKYDDKPYKVFKIYLRDNEQNETYLCDFRSTRLSRSAFNSLLSLESFENVSFSLYKTVGKDNKEYSNISVWQNNKMVKGKFSNEELPQPAETKNSKGVIVAYEYDELDEFYVKELNKLAKKIQSSKSKTPTEDKETQPQPEHSEQSEPTQKPKGEEEDVPF